MAEISPNLKKTVNPQIQETYTPDKTDTHTYTPQNTIRKMLKINDKKNSYNQVEENKDITYK